MGLEASRPDKELRTGPDVLWLTPDGSSGALLEAKTKKLPTTQYQKDEIGQMHDHVAWAKATFPKITFVEAIVGRPLAVSKDSNPSPRLCVIDLAEFQRRSERAREFFDLLCVSAPSGAARDSEAEAGLRSLGLKWPVCLDSLTSILAVDLKREPPSDREVG